ncbi:MAG: alpha-glucan phosphorylase [uncultured bacterium]|nr:MAG: alpha-glucan phosphorylase [uncultured bacterium]OGH13745.1 MAG: hypothetical protein A2687_03055 [Candidatus Levybacteria bacterium RIFCSPHIGHO2_01_FULL_38_26]
MAAAEQLSHNGLIPELPSKKTFLDVIGRSELKKILSPQTPILSISMENDALGGAFAGGLGILEGDKFHQAADAGIPYAALTFSPPDRWRQKLSNLWPGEETYSVHPENNGFKKEPVSINIKANGDEPSLELYTQELGSSRMVTTYENGLKGLYHGATDSEHRLYQKAVLGFGGFKAIKELGINPPIVLVNESPAAFYPLAELDQLCQDGKPLPQALSQVREKTIYVNHTLEQAAEAEFNEDQTERYVSRNLKSESVRNWLAEMVEKGGGRLKLSNLALALAKRYIGVSQPHAQKASEQFRNIDGQNVSFDAITNGVHSRWTHPDFLRMDREKGVIDEFGLPSPDSLERILSLDPSLQIAIKNKARRELREYLPTRLDQYNQPIYIPDGSRTIGWARRPVPYKRPEMPFEDPERLAEILESENAHFLFAGKVPNMGRDIPEILYTIDKNPILRNRAHYIQDYDKDLARRMVAGTDLWLNNPIVGKEACGTSIFKAIKNRTILVSTDDGGVADVRPSPALIISGQNHQQEVDSLYRQTQRGLRIVDGKDPESWDYSVKRQLAGYNEKASGARNLKDIINYAFPQPNSLRLAA